MARGRPKKNKEGVEMPVETRETVEVRESTEAAEIESISTASYELKKFIASYADPQRKLSNVDVKNIIDLSKVINKYICNVETSVEICEKYIRNIGSSTGCLRLYSRKFFNSENVRLQGIDVFVEVKTPQPNVDYKLKVVYLTYDLTANVTNEVEILTI